MFGVGFVKAPPTRFVIHYKSGKIQREGAGLSFFYFAPSSTIVSIPIGSSDVPFVFNETTADFQAITIQGQLTYRISKPKLVADLLDFTIGPGGRYLSDDYQVLGNRLIAAMQIRTRAVTQKLMLRDALLRSEPIVAEVLAGIRASEVSSMLGLEVIGLTIASIQPTPEMGRALEAEAREELQQKADSAIYARRNAAVEQERRIKESELATELAVEEKQRQIREAKMAADIAVEAQRAALIDSRVANERKDSDSRAYALKATLEPLRDVDWHLLTALTAGQGDPRTQIALAFRELAENAQKIGELNISPELLGALLDPKKS